ncbi:Bifunctional nitrilase/nitrile hydratase NIT4 [Tolypocladium ophioglossoides CBS 100239]|uniref:Bifunctional nitrilase/nitrile hydratase NIT4 n=1 Tax=Tolypocladium ophioglossoides (strain CBS 100239) TaxID=1163406 RepID=A0A0L0NKN3_TOLOC|nr:Bifunctional nitrilase/nitrile hydratase NIT4 [Tolypocladium ophioglossoides CBS 100239]
MSTLRIGTASPATGPTKAATLSALADLARRAAAAHVDILLLPEAYLGGYPRGTSFGCVIGERTHAGREEFAAYFDQAVDFGDTVGGGAGAGTKWIKRELGGDGETARGDGTREELEHLARETGVFLVTGCIEKAGGSMYCAVVYVCPKEGIVGKRRKVMPVRPPRPSPSPPRFSLSASCLFASCPRRTSATDAATPRQTGTERLVWAQGCPSTLRAVSTTIRGTRVNLAAAICWENYMPLLRQSLYAQNVNLYLAPTADSRDAWLGLMRTVGVEGRCFVVSSNMCVRSQGTSRRAAPQRRSSTFTEEGFEIALPAGPPPPPRARRRRKSVFDEDGNEIVLCCPASDENGVNGTAPPANAAARGKAASKAASFSSRGGSCIVSPFGDVLAGPQWEDDEGLIFADVDMRECIRGRLDLDTAGSYSRGDSFKFSVQGLDLDPLPY